LEVVETAGHSGLSPGDRATLEDAIEHDLETASLQGADSEARLAKLEGGVEAAATKALVDEDRLVHVEKQTHGLAEAVIAITETADMPGRIILLRIAFALAAGCSIWASVSLFRRSRRASHSRGTSTATTVQPFEFA
jgi:hypothetical protein